MPSEYTHELKPRAYMRDLRYYKPITREKLKRIIVGVPQNSPLSNERILGELESMSFYLAWIIGEAENSAIEN